MPAVYPYTPCNTSQVLISFLKAMGYHADDYYNDGEHNSWNVCLNGDAILFNYPCEQEAWFAAAAHWFEQPIKSAEGLGALFG